MNILYNIHIAQQPTPKQGKYMGGNTGSWGTQIDVHDPQISQFKQTHNISFHNKLYKTVDLHPAIVDGITHHKGQKQYHGKHDTDE